MKNDLSMKRFISVLVSLLLIISTPVFANGNSSSSQSSKQYQALLTSLADAGQSIENMNRSVTRAEFAFLASHLFNYNKASTKKFKDVEESDWYFEAIVCAAGQGFFKGDNAGNANPNEPVLLEDAAVMVATMLKSKPDTSIAFRDAEEIAEYAKTSVGAMVKKGYLSTDLEGAIHPKKTMTLEDTLKLLSNVSGEVLSNGEYDYKNKEINGNITITTAGVIMKNGVVNGDLYITEGVGTGEVTLDNVIVKGETIVSGGGMNSIVFVNTKLGVLKVSVPDGTPVRIVASGDSSINMAEVNSESKIQNKGITGEGFQEIVISVPKDSKVSLEGDFKAVTVDSQSAKLDVLGGKIDSMTISENSADAKINIASKAVVVSVTANSDAKIGGTGKIENAIISAPNVTIAQKPDNTQINGNISSNINNEVVSGSNNSTSNANNANNSSSDISNKNKKWLKYDYVQCTKMQTGMFVEMVFTEPVEFLIGGINATATQLNSSFYCMNGSDKINIDKVNVTDNIVAFYLPVVLENKKYSIELIDSTGWTLRGKTSAMTYNSMNKNFLPFTVTDRKPLTIKGPNDVTVYAGETAEFKLEITNPTNNKHSVQWYMNGTPIKGATNTTFSMQTGLSDNAAKVHAEVSVSYGSNMKDVYTSQTAMLTVLAKGSVILAEGSEGVAGDCCITDLKTGYRYYLIKLAENKTYPVLKDGTLGDSTAEVVYENLEPLEVTTIGNLVNDERYMVVKLLAKTPKLTAFSIKGCVDDFNFYGYVSPTIEAQIARSVYNVNLTTAVSTPDAIINITKSDNINTTPDTVHNDIQNPNGYYIYVNPYAIRTEIVIKTSVPSEPENATVYVLVLTPNTSTVVTYNGTEYAEGNIAEFTEQIGYFQISMLEANQKFVGMKYALNDNAPLEMKQDIDYKINESFGVITINIEESINKICNVDDKIKFIFLFEGGTSQQKDLVLQKVVAEPKYDIVFGTPRFVETDVQKWMEIFVPLSFEGKAITLDELTQQYGEIHIQPNFKFVNGDGYGYNPSLRSYEDGSEKGAILSIETPPSSTRNYSITNKINLSYYGKNGIHLINSSDLTIAEGNVTTGTIQFKDSVENEIKPTEDFALSKQTYTLTIPENIPITFNYIPEEDATVYSCFIQPGYTSISMNGSNLQLYVKSEENEPGIVFALAEKNCIPQEYAFYLNGNVVSRFITSANLYLHDDSFQTVSYRIQGSFSAWNTSCLIAEDLKKYSLDPADVIFTIGTDENGDSISRSLKQMNDEDIGTTLSYIYFDGIKSFFKFFDFNPLTDSLSQTINTSFTLSGEASKYKLDDYAINYGGIHNGKLSKITIKDKNSDQRLEFPVSDDSGTIDIKTPYSEAAIFTTSTGNYECIAFDEDAIPIDSKGLILTPNKPQSIAIVVARYNSFPKIYKVNLTYVPDPAANKERSANFGVVNVITMLDEATELEMQSPVIDQVAEPVSTDTDQVTEPVSTDTDQSTNDESQEDISII